MASRITILSFGTRGDVEPLVALAEGLRWAGHEVTLGADTEFEPLVRAHDISYTPLVLNLRQFLESEAGRAAMHSSASNRSGTPTFDEMVRPMLDDCWRAAQGADLLLYDTMLTAAHHIAEKLGIPAIMTSVMPNMSPTRAFPLIGGPRLPLNGIANRLTYELYRLSWLLAYPTMRRWCRETLGLTLRSPLLDYWRLRGRPVPILYSYSQHLLPSPPDWHAETVASGYWFLNKTQGWQPPPELEAFLADGSPPVAIGFGSMIGLDPRHLTELVIAAVKASGERAILMTGWGGLVDKRLPDTMLCVREVPHEWLFPRVSAVVHHGGAGTTAAGLRWGKPSILCPFVTDQFFWGEIVARRGLGPVPIPQKQLTAQSLAAAIRRATHDSAIRARAAALGKAIRQEDGVGQAVGFITRYLAPTTVGHQMSDVRRQTSDVTTTDYSL